MELEFLEKHSLKRLGDFKRGECFIDQYLDDGFELKHGIVHMIINSPLLPDGFIYSVRLNNRDDKNFPYNNPGEITRCDKENCKDDKVIPVEIINGKIKYL